MSNIVRFTHKLNEKMTQKVLKAPLLVFTLNVVLDDKNETNVLQSRQQCHFASFKLYTVLVLSKLKK